jgi:hypothetical protein
MADPTGSTEASVPSDGPPADGPAVLQASSLAGTWDRIKEHKVLQWGLGYLGAALLIAHGQELMAQAFDWPLPRSRCTCGTVAAGNHRSRHLRSRKSGGNGSNTPG